MPSPEDWSQLLAERDDLRRRCQAAEAKAVRAEARLRALLDHTPDSIFIRDREGCYLDINPAGAAALGLTVDRVRGRHAGEIMEPALARHLLEQDAQIMEDGVARLDEWCCVDGHRFETNKFPYYGPGGEVLGVMGIARDVTEASRLEQEIAHQVDLTWRTLDHVPAGIAFLDAHKVFRWVNSAYCAMWGISEAEFVGRHLHEFFPRTPQESPFDLVNQRLEALELRAFSYVQSRPEGPRQTYWDIAFVPVLRAGDLDGYLVLTIEVSARVEGERMQREQIEQLRALDRLKSEFISTASHELRTPLSSILGFAEFLEDGVAGPVTDLQLEYLQAILGNAMRLQGLVDDLLDFARIEAGVFGLDLTEADVGEVLTHEVATLRALALKKGITLESRMPTDPPTLRLDPRRVGQVITNLVSNAIKFTPEGGRVDVTAALEPDALRVEVRDTGIGIPRECLPRVFEKFYQVDQALTRAHGGAGLGLAISRALVEAHGGRIGVDSIPDEGTTFWFTLPVGTEP